MPPPPSPPPFSLQPPRRIIATTEDPDTPLSSPPVPPPPPQAALGLPDPPIVSQHEQKEFPCIVKFRQTGEFTPPDVKTAEGLKETKDLVDAWENQGKLPRELVEAWRSHHVPIDSTNPGELDLFKQQTKLRKAAEKVRKRQYRFSIVILSLSLKTLIHNLE